MDIKEHRRKLKLSQAGLAKALGVSTLTVLRWESGKTSIPDSRLPLLKSLTTAGTIAVIGNIRVSMNTFPAEHQPAHFHVMVGNKDIQFRMTIPELAVMDNIAKVSNRDMQTVRKWAGSELVMDQLKKNWGLCMAGKAPEKIGVAP